MDRRDPTHGAPHVKHLTGPLWEMRMSGRDEGRVHSE